MTEGRQRNVSEHEFSIGHPSMTRWVYGFGGARTDGRAEMSALLGGKGANLAEMARLGLPVPPGFTVTTEVCTRFYAGGERYPEGLEEQVEAALAEIEAAVGRRFGGAADPLLVSVRSGARVSMPGMMDTILNLGLNDRTVEALAASSGDRRFAFDSYRRFVQMFADVALGVDRGLFEEEIEILKDGKGVDADADLDAGDWSGLVARFKEIVLEETGAPFPQEPRAQLWEAVGAVMRSWRTPRAQTYRRLHAIPEEWGTGVNVQAMVFGNMGADCATGVAFTRNPSTGENALYGEYLINAQGEDVVAGIRTPQSLTVADAEARGSRLPPMEQVMPEAFARLMEMRERLERHFRDMQDIEFTVEAGRLWMLQTRSGKRTAQAALQIAVDMVEDGTIGPEEAVMRVEPQALEQLLHPTLDPEAERDVIARGLPASPGAASGRIVFTADAAEQAAANGEAVILVRSETSPEDIHGMHAARGILTSRGGMTSHAAVVARGMGRACVSGAGAVRIDVEDGVMLANGRTFTTEDRITIDGGSGEVMAGEIATIQPEMTGGFARLMEWADGARRLRVAGQCGDAPRRRGRARLRGGGYRALPHGAHVLRHGPHPRHARDDPGRRRGRAPRRARQAAADAAAGFRRAVPDHGGPAGDDPAAGPAAARIPAAHRGGNRRSGRGRRRRCGEAAPPGAASGRGQPDARPSRLPARHHLARDLRDAGPRDLRSRRANRSRAGSHGAAGRHRERTGAYQSRHRPHGGDGGRGDGQDARLEHRHDDRAAARRTQGRRDRRGRRVLLFRPPTT